MKNNKYILIIFLAIFLFLSFSFAFAALEIKYPPVPGLPDINQNNPGISEFVGYFFGLGIYIAGILSLISFTIGAVGIIGASATGDPSKRGESIDRIKGALLGLVLTLASFIIIRTINPALITPSLSPLPGVQGVFLINGAKQERPVAIQVSDVSAEQAVKDGYTSLFYDCKDATLAPALLVWEFSNTNLEAGDDTFSGVQVKRMNCQDTEPIANLGSFRMEFETPGVYYCLGGCSGDMCSGYMSGANTNDQDSISAPFFNDIGGVRIVNSKNANYGVIFHETPGLSNGGYCYYPIINNSQTTKCEPVVNILASAADIFVVNSGLDTSSGDGVSFFSEPYGWDTGAKAGFYNVSDAEIDNFKDFKQYPDKMCFNYKNVDRTDAYKYMCSHEDSNNCKIQDNSCESNADCLESIGETCDQLTKTCLGENGETFCSDNACETFQDCPGSMKIKGSYLVGLYSMPNGEKKLPYCQTFTKDTPNMNTESFIASGGASLESVFIIPTK